MFVLTWIFAVVFGSRKDLTVFHNILNPEPALMMNMRFKVCIESTNFMILQLGNPQYNYFLKKSYIFFSKYQQNRTKTYFRIIVTIDLLKARDKLPGLFVEVLKPL